MIQQLDSIQREIDVIKKRNKRVEADKAWETSWAHRILVAVLTYIVIVIFMIISRLEQPFISALVPSAAYLISMSTLSIFKKHWIKRKIK